MFAILFIEIECQGFGESKLVATCQTIEQVETALNALYKQRKEYLTNEHGYVYDTESKLIQREHEQELYYQEHWAVFQLPDNGIFHDGLKPISTWRMHG